MLVEIAARRCPPESGKLLAASVASSFVIADAEGGAQSLRPQLALSAISGVPRLREPWPAKKVAHVGRTVKPSSCIDTVSDFPL